MKIIASTNSRHHNTDIVEMTQHGIIKAAGFSCSYGSAWESQNGGRDVKVGTDIKFSGPNVATAISGTRHTEGGIMNAFSRADCIPPEATGPTVVSSDALRNGAHRNQSSSGGHNGRAELLPKRQRQFLLDRQYTAIPVEDTAPVDTQVAKLINAHHAHAIWPADWIRNVERHLLQSPLSLVISVTHRTASTWPAAIHLHSQTEDGEEDREISQTPPAVHVLLRLSSTFSLPFIELSLLSILDLFRRSKEPVAPGKLCPFQLLDFIAREALAAHGPNQVGGQERECNCIKYQTYLTPPFCREHVRHPFRTRDQLSADSLIPSNAGLSGYLVYSQYPTPQPGERVS
jgi:hypothetical protein